MGYDILLSDRCRKIRKRTRGNPSTSGKDNTMYAICVEYYGNYGAIVPAGNDGIQKLHNNTR